MFRGVPVIDADSHKIENAVIFQDYIDSRFRDRVRIVSDRHGEQRIAITDRNPRTGAADFVRLYPQPDGLGKGAFRALHPDTAMGALFNRIRIRHMDQEGIDVQIIYGSLTLILASLIDAELAAALCRAYNDYIRDDCEPYRTRLIPVGAVPMQDIGEAVREMRRCVEQLGMPAVSIAPNLPLPHPDAPEAFPMVRAPRHLSDPQFFPLYEVAQQLGISLGIHGTPGAYLCGGSADQLDTFSLVHIFGHRSQQQMAIAKLVMDGVLERFPHLRFGFLEAGCGWLPDLVHALHEHWEKRVRDFRPDFRLPRAQFALESLRDRNRTAGVGHRARNLLGIACGCALGGDERRRRPPLPLRAPGPAARSPGVFRPRAGIHDVRGGRPGTALPARSDGPGRRAHRRLVGGLRSLGRRAGSMHAAHRREPPHRPRLRRAPAFDQRPRVLRQPPARSDRVAIRNAAIAVGRAEGAPRRAATALHGGGHQRSVAGLEHGRLEPARAGVVRADEDSVSTEPSPNGNGRRKQRPTTSSRPHAV